ncbi:MAG: ankyrin repeat domain-containing protein [Desulfomonilaceae bacterium]
MTKELIAEFIDAAVKDHSRAQHLLMKNPELHDARWIRDETILHFLAVEGYLDAVRFLGGLGFDVNARNEFGDGPIIDVVTIGNVEMVEALLALGADPNATSTTNDNALNCAVRSGKVELVDLLLNAGARADYVTDLGESIFEVASQSPGVQDPILNVLEKH